MSTRITRRLEALEQSHGSGAGASVAVFPWSDVPESVEEAQRLYVAFVSMDGTRREWKRPAGPIVEPTPAEAEAAYRKMCGE